MTAISADDVLEILAEQPGNKNKSDEWLRSHWLTSRSFKLTTVHVHLPELGVSPGKTGESRSRGPIIVEENFRQVARGGGGMHGAAPDFLVLDGQNRVVAERKKGPRATIRAYVGDKIFGKLRKQDDDFGKAYKDLQRDIEDYLTTPKMPGRKLSKLKVYVQQGILTQKELDEIRAEWKARHSQQRSGGSGMKREAIVKKHPERGVWCLFDSDGKKALNCFKNRYKSKKPPQEAIDRAERIVQFYKHQAKDMAVRVASRWLER